MAELDISDHFSDFEPTDAQLRKIARLLKKVQRSWGIEYGDSVLEATLLLAPRELSRLTPAAYQLLKRCQARVWEFKVQLQRQYGAFHKQTYQELFDLLVSLKLIEEGTASQKLKGSKKVDDLRMLLKSRGLSDKGKKDELVQRTIENLAEEEVETLVDGVILFRTTDAGDRTIQTVGDLFPAVRMAFYNAAVGTRICSKESKKASSELAPEVLYDDGEVHITEKDVDRAIAEWDRRIPEAAGLLGATTEDQAQTHGTDTKGTKQSGSSDETTGE